MLEPLLAFPFAKVVGRDGPARYAGNAEYLVGVLCVTEGRSYGDYIRNFESSFDCQSWELTANGRIPDDLVGHEKVTGSTNRWATASPGGPQATGNSQPWHFRNSSAVSGPSMRYVGSCGSRFSTLGSKSW
jgi:hypothetical protein